MEGMVIKVIQNHLREECFEYDNQVNFLDLSLRDDILMDSIEIIELVMVLEKEFKIIIPDDSIENTNTIGEIVNITKEILNNAIS